MNDERELKRRQAMTFEEAEGLVLPPVQFRDGNLTREFRNGVWTAFYTMFREGRIMPRYSTRPMFGPSLGALLYNELLHRQHVPIDEVQKKIIESNADVIISEYKMRILHGSTSELLGFLQWVVRDPDCPGSFVEQLSDLFARLPGPYSLLGVPLTILPASSTEERQAVDRGLREVNQSELSGAKAHLSSASQALSDGNFAEAIRESVLAMEGAASRIVGKKATLSDALRALEKDKALHPALKQGFDKLYAYSNDEQGLRHALVDADSASVDGPEAIFMFEAAIAFISYLSRKHLKVNSRT